MFGRKRSMFITGFLLFVLVFSGCNSLRNSIKTQDKISEIELAVRSADSHVTIGLALGTLAEERWVNEKKMFEAEAERNGARVIAQDANMDENIQSVQVENLISQNIDVLVIVAVNAETAAASVEAAKKADIPVMAYSRLIRNADLDAFIGFDAVLIGETLARAAVKNVPNGNYMIINGARIDNNAKQQQEGYYNILQPYIDKGFINIVYEQWCENWSPKTALTAAENGLTESGGKIDAVIVSNDGMAGGVIQALEARGLDKKVFVTGTDGELAALRRIAEGTQSVTILFPQKEFAEEGARAAISLANGMIPADATGRIYNGFKDVPTIFAKIVPVSKENLEDVVQKPDINDTDVTIR